jgi:hypothetical protein
MKAFLDSASAATKFPKVLSAKQEDLYAAWRVWLKETYC